jgi:hypothetical protein
MIRLDPQISKDYNCIFVEGHSAKGFTVPWLSRSTPAQYLRLRYTPNDEHQAYGIMFIDPQALAYEAHDCCAVAPAHLASQLSSPQPILDWMRSQPHSALASSHTNDANEIYKTICALKSSDLEHFTLPANFPLKNFVIGHQSLARRDGPDLLTFSLLVMLLAPMIAKIIGARKSNLTPRAGRPSEKRPATASGSIPVVWRVGR